jgi:hypothetical protein
MKTKQQSNTQKKGRTTMDANNVASIEFHEKSTPAPDAQAAAVQAARDYLGTAEASKAPKVVIDYAKKRVATLEAAKPAKRRKSPPPSPDVPATQITVTAENLEQLIVSATEKLGALKAANYVTDNKRTEQRNIDACRGGIESCDVSIARFDTLIAQALEKLDAAIEAPPAVGLWGVPQTADQTGRVQGLATEFAAMKQARWRQVQSKTTLEQRLSQLLAQQAR